MDIILDYLLLPPTAAEAEIEAALARIEGVDEESRLLFAKLCCVSERGEADPRAVAVLYKIFTTLVERHASDLFPLLVILDNAPFMDKLSRAFFAYWFRNGRIKPFFVLTGRDFPPELRKTFQGLTQLRLEPLPPESAADLAKAWWPDAGKEALGKILDAGMGNPLFVREYAIWARGHRDISMLPATVQNIFLATLERYPPARRDLARKLSVFSHSFSADNARRVEEATGGDPAAVDESLEAFAAAGLIVPSGKEGWSFRVDVLKKALYSSLLNHNKRILHGIIADILIGQARPNRARLIGHLMRADRNAEAVDVMNRDPNRTYNYEYLPLIEALSRKAAGDEDLLVRLLVVKAALLFNRGRIEESEEVLKRILRTAVAKRSDILMGYAYHHICAFNAMSHSFQKALFTGEKALHYYGRTKGGAPGMQDILRYMALSRIQRAELDEARLLVARSEGLAACMDEGCWDDSFGARAEYHLYAGDYHRALSVVEEGLAGLEVERVAARFFALELRVRTLWQLCDFEALIPAARELLSFGFLSESHLSQASAMLGLACHTSGDREGARDSFVQAEIYAGQVRNDFDKLDALRTLSLCRYLAGEGRKAEETANEALVLGLRHSGFWPTFTLLLIMVEGAYGRGKLERARFFLGEASYLFTTGFLLPAKDQILYYWLASRLLDDGEAERRVEVACRLLEEEKARLGEPRLVAAFLAQRSFGKIDEELAKLSGRAAS